MPQLGDVVKVKGKKVDLIVNELALIKQIIEERVHPLDLLRELLSNAASKEVGAAKIVIKYTIDEEGHIFEVADDGCGMDYTGDEKNPGRLDKFFGLGLSSIVGIKSDEFSWKGLGSKLAYQSKKIEIDTWCGSGNAYRVEINEPWSSIERKLKPKPIVFEYEPSADRKTGTSIRVVGHPPYRKDIPFTSEQIDTYLKHRSFAGFTKERESPPEIVLSVLGQTKRLTVGFPELTINESREGIVFVDEAEKVVQPGTNKEISIRMKGFYTWDDTDYGLSKNQNNTGLILSVKGIPYFTIDMGEYGSKNLRTVRPGENKCCLVLECDSIQERMNISRSGIVDSLEKDLLKNGCRKIFSKIEASPEYLEFRRVQEKRKSIQSAEQLDSKKRALESENQKWVVYQENKTSTPIVLLREPENENDALAILWKLEALDALPFKTFKTLGHAGTGPDLIVHFQEDESSHPDRYTSIEVENRFYNYKLHGHRPSQYPRVICWEIGRTTKIPIDKTDKRYKYTTDLEDFQVHIFALRQMAGIKVITKKDFSAKEIIL